MKKMIKNKLYISRLFSMLIAVAVVTLTGCDSGGDGGGGGDGDGGEVHPAITTPENNKSANFQLTLAPQGGEEYMLIVIITKAVPGSSVNQSNAENNYTGSINESGIYQREHAVYNAGSGEVTVTITITDPDGEVLTKALKQKIPAKELGLTT
ncbi:hypothetical protein P3T73_17890 [Kiritimatiellota bacterium B12222]|nr:hypothetical protein P3T73_17890 [Kiritimatiellota bacterium B12222]